MSEKRKPYVTISIKKPRISHLVSLMLILIIGAVAGTFGIQEYGRWQETKAELRETEGLLTEQTTRLQETEANLQATEAELQAVKSKYNAEEYLRVWQSHEPAGFHIDRENGGLVLQAVTCYIPQDNEPSNDVYDDIGPLVHYNIVNRHTVMTLSQSDKYKLVGQDQMSAGWADDEYVSQHYYTHQAVFDRYPYTWSSSKDWGSNWRGWDERIRTYCQETFRL